MKENLVKLGMTLFEGKKVNMVGVKLSQSMEDIFQEICKELDRPMSYVVRELALRGLAQYVKDGQLKLTPDEEKAIQNKRIESDKNVSKRQTVPVLREGAGANDKKKK
jgi:hypothetical protein